MSPLFFFLTITTLVFGLSVIDPLFPNLVDVTVQRILAFLGRKAMQAKMEAELLYLEVDQDRYLNFVQKAYPNNPKE
jgi:hypothetical protein